VSVATLAVRGPLSEALQASALRALDGPALVDALSPRRWFGGKGGVADARVRDVTPLFPGTAVARIVVERPGRDPSVYQLPLVLRRAEADPKAIVARVESEEGSALLLDAMADLEFLAELGRAFADGKSFPGEGTRWTVSPSGRAFECPKPLSAEQSNTSVFYGDAILKLYRRLVVGEHPDVEIGEFLTAHGSPHVPKLLGTMALEDADGARSIAGMVQEVVPSIGDGWSVALEAARTGTDFGLRASEIGRVTRELHEALASDPDAPAFAPRPLDREEIERLGERVQGQIARALDLLAERLRKPAPSWASRRARLEGLLGRRDEAAALARRATIAFAAMPGAAIRHHGDYHLGQVLIGRNERIVVVDFEGEPARPLAERRARASALRDVAGMVRSFSYAAQFALAERASESGCEGAAARWEESARESFLRAYFGSGRNESILPAGERARAFALALFELEKVFYELEYELDNRPDWIGVPLAGVEHVLRSERPAL
jgi:maltokinase